MEIFKLSHDTIHIEYFSSLRLLRTNLHKIRNSPGKSGFKGRSLSELFQAQFAILEALDETGEPLRNTLVDYGLSLFRKGKTEKALEAMYRARNLSLKADDLASLALADYSIITNLPVSYDLVETKNEVLRSDIELFEAKKSSIPVKIYTSYFYTLLGSNYYEYLDNIDSAVVCSEKALSVLNTLKYSSSSIRAATHGSLAKYYAEKGDTNKVWEHVKKVRNLTGTKSMSAYNRAFAYTLISEAVLQNSIDSAYLYLTVLDSLPGKKYFSDKVRELKAEVFLKKGNTKKAESILAGGFENFDMIGDFKVPKISAETDYFSQLSLLGMLEKTYTGMSHENQSDCTQAIVDLISLQAQLFQKIMDENVFGYEETGVSQIYDEFIERTLPYLFELDNSAYYDETIKIALASKAIHLNSLIAKKRFQATLENDTTIFTQLLKSAEKIQNSRNKIASTDTSNEVKYRELKTELNTRLIENLMLRYKLEEKVKSRESEVFNDKLDLVSPENIQAQLKNDEAVIEYFIFGKSWGQILILPDTTRCFYYKDDELPRKIEKERYAIMTGRETTDIGQFLFREIHPFLKGIKKLIIIPDDNLNYIPFECMKFNERMLIEDFVISYSYSSSLMHKLRKNRDFKLPKNLLAIAPLFEQKVKQNIPYYTSRYWGSERIEALPYSKEEVAGIAPVMQNMLDSVTLITGEDATVAKVKDQIPHYDIIHFASHGVVNSDHPERSGLFLFVDDTSGNELEEKIDIFSLGIFLNMQMNAELLVLSACNSGKGNYLKGEGIIALPRGAILSGVPRVLASLWKVNDEKTKDIMLLFYKYLSEGKTYSQALRQAKLQAIKEGYITRNWAGFVLIGG